MPTREELMAWGIRAKKTIDLGEGMAFTIQQLNVSEMQDASKRAEAMKKSDDDNLPLCVCILAKSAINEDGSLIFNDGDEVALLRDWSYERLGRLATPIFELNGILKSQAEQTEKN